MERRLVEVLNRGCGGLMSLAIITIEQTTFAAGSIPSVSLIV